MPKRSDCGERNKETTNAVPEHDEGHGRNPVETPQETRDAIGRIKGLFIDIEREMGLQKKQKNPNAVAWDVRR